MLTRKTPKARRIAIALIHFGVYADGCFLGGIALIGAELSPEFSTEVLTRAAICARG